MRRCRSSATFPSQCRPANCVSSLGRPVRASRRCSARSTVSSHTSRAASCTAASQSTVATPRAIPPRDFADVVGFVMQDPLAGCVTDTLEEELAYVMEQLAVDPQVMRKHVEEILDLLGIADLRARSLSQLSGGQLQRAAIGAALTAHPGVLVLDEPTSALDPTGAEEVLAAITRLVHDLGVTVVMAEHRLERVVQYADPIAYLAGDGSVVHGLPADLFLHTTVAPPIVELGRAARWSPLPLSIRDDASRRGAAADATRRDRSPVGRPRPGRGAASCPHGPRHRREVRLTRRGARGRPRATRGRGHRPDGPQRFRQVVAVVGVAGFGAAGLGTRRCCGGRSAHGECGTRAHARRLGPADTFRSVVPRHRCRRARAGRRRIERVRRARAAILDRLVPGIAGEMHPRDCSEGQRLALVLAIQLTAAPKVLLLDEPTRGLDYDAKQQLGHILAELAAMVVRSSCRHTTWSSSPRTRTAYCSWRWAS